MLGQCGQAGLPKKKFFEVHVFDHIMLGSARCTIGMNVVPFQFIQVRAKGRCRRCRDVKSEVWGNQRDAMPYQLIQTADKVRWLSS